LRSAANNLSLAASAQPSVAREVDRHAWTLVALGAVVVLSRWLWRANVADGFDSINFLLGMSKGFDMAHFQPHFPGYPVYVALGALLCRLGLRALTAATAISSMAAGASGVGLAICAERLAGRAAGIPVMLLHLVAWQPLLLGSGALSDSLGVALAIAAFAFLASKDPRPAASGFFGGLLLGTRASYWPMLGSLFILSWKLESKGSARLRFLAGLAVGTLVWAIPFFAMVGLRSFVDLGSKHLAGHFGWWGGTIATVPGLPRRVGAFLRDIGYDGFAPSWWAVGAIVGVVTALFLLSRLRRQPLGAPIPWAPVLVAVGPYAVWAFFAQNVVDQPRHALPLVESAILLLGCLLSAHRLAVALIALAAATVNLPLLLERQRLGPAPAQAAAWLLGHAAPADTAIMADRSWRFFTELPGGYLVKQHAWLSEVVVDLARFNRLPPNIYLTSEVDPHSGLGEGSALPRFWKLEPGPQFCRDPRIDRALPCLGLTQLLWSRQ
jgi:hypothetical protein